MNSKVIDSDFVAFLSNQSKPVQKLDFSMFLLSAHHSSGTLIVLSAGIVPIELQLSR
jgi:hypothetical protein